MKKELVSFNAVVRDISSLPELSDETLETVVGGAVISPNTPSLPGTCATDNACEPNCRCNYLA
ncbi:hypothetical protein CYFUS_009508 [Cystobacter fuscus]|uniref:Uncharacterized protein n=1 Tax=Cystobacter fuscus TaxID=43 RepID=A0A250JKM3_9BACT|nr:hypothetical protein [Cystobacter fuscus]ATB44027.1 hypothetical protein CYFUS_009508 [Cystobacter fuscus]